MTVKNLPVSKFAGGKSAGKFSDSQEICYSENLLAEIRWVNLPADLGTVTKPASQ